MKEKKIYEIELLPFFRHQFEEKKINGTDGLWNKA
jgi:hypothetical protein